MATVSHSARAAAASVFFAETTYRELGHTGTEALADVAAVAFCLLAYMGTAGLAGRAREVLQPKIGTSHAVVIRYAIVLLGSVATILITLQLFGIAVMQLLVGGVFATILVGIAAQQSLSNLFAGMVLLLARPVDIGDRVLIRSGYQHPWVTDRQTEPGQPQGRRYSTPPRRAAPAIRPLRVWPAPMICLLNVLAESPGNAVTWASASASS